MLIIKEHNFLILGVKEHVLHKREIVASWKERIPSQNPFTMHLFVKHFFHYSNIFIRVAPVTTRIFYERIMCVNFKEILDYLNLKTNFFKNK